MSFFINEKHSLLKQLNNCKVEIKNLGVKNLSLFDSFVNHTAGKESDIDLLIEYKIVWHTIQNKLPELNKEVSDILNSEKN